MKCQYPHWRFIQCHVCDNCRSEDDAKTFAENTRDTGTCKGDIDVLIIYYPISSSKINSNNNCETTHEGKFDCWRNADLDWICEDARIRGKITSIHEKQHGHWIE